MTTNQWIDFFMNVVWPVLVVGMIVGGVALLWHDLREDPCDYEPVYVTKTGKIMTRRDFDKLADEAERGYEVPDRPDWRRRG